MSFDPSQFSGYMRLLKFIEDQTCGPQVLYSDMR